MPNLEKSRAITISNYHPISLMTSLYKIIAEVVSNKIEEIPHEVIGGNRFSFIKQTKCWQYIDCERMCGGVLGEAKEKLGLKI